MKSDRVVNVKSMTWDATLTFQKGSVINATSWLMWLMGRSEDEAKRICTQRGYQWTVIE